MSCHSSRLRLFGVVVAASIAALTPIAPLASAQSNATYVITSSNFVIPTQPFTTIEIWAVWTDPSAAFVFGGGNYDLIATDSVFSNATNILNGPGSSAGIAAGNTVTGGANGQVHIPPLGLFGLEDNPILLASYTWTTSDFTPRFVYFDTVNTSNFLVSDLNTGATTQLYPNAFKHGRGTLPIGNWPTPSTLSVLVLGGVLASRRKRTV